MSMKVINPSRFLDVNYRQNVEHGFIWCAPWSGVNPFEDSPMWSCGKLGSKGTLPASNSKKGYRVELGAQGLD
jgi:hypothetical protein